MGSELSLADCAGRGSSRQYLCLLANEIRVSVKEVTTTDSKAALMLAVLQKKMGTAMVPILKQFLFPIRIQTRNQIPP
jgi:hypothetical protein